MKPKIKKLQFKKEFIFHIQFQDGHEGDIDFKPYLWGEAFELLKNPTYFQRAFIDKTTGTITWPNGADIAPETLYQKLAKTSNSVQI